MKKFVLPLFMILSLSAFSQKLDTLKFPPETAKTIAELDKELKDLEPARILIEQKNKQKLDMLKSAMDWNKIPYTRFREYIPGVGILLNKEEEKK